jgi:hypothetical protein
MGPYIVHRVTDQGLYILEKEGKGPMKTAINPCNVKMYNE